MVVAIYRLYSSHGDEELCIKLCENSQILKLI